jgi:CheY-like chemotaxis protein
MTDGLSESTEQINRDASMQREKVLIADDDADTVEMMSILVQNFALEPLTASDGFEALNTAKLYRPQSIILDVGLPGLDGFEVARQLRATKDLAESTIIGVSGHADNYSIDRAHEAGMDFYLAKPANVDLLLGCLKLKKLAGDITDEELAYWSEETRTIGTEIRNRAAVLSDRSKKALARASDICKRYESHFHRGGGAASTASILAMNGRSNSENNDVGYRTRTFSPEQGLSP